MPSKILWTMAVLMSASTACATPLWQTLPPTPKITSAEGRFVDVGGTRIFYRKSGKGPAVVLLHGGLANSDYMASPFTALAKTHTVIAIDTRGHGRSGAGTAPLTYERMADDVVAVLNDAGVATAAIVGWSDGAITGLDLAMRYPARVTRVFAFGANTDPSGLKDDIDKNPTFATFEHRAHREYDLLAPRGSSFTQLRDTLSALYAKAPRWSDAELQRITVPIVIADGDHDEGIRREHTEHIAAAIPGAGLLILPNTSHFAFLQDPALFNAAVATFLAK